MPTQALLSFYQKLFLYLLFCSSLLTSLLSTLLPFWVAATVDIGLQVVEVNKNLMSGFWFKYETFGYDPKSLESSDGLTGVVGTSYDTDGLKSVVGLMMTALSFLVLGFIFAILTSSRCSNCSEGRDAKVQVTLIAVMPAIAAVCMAVGVIVFYKQVLDEYDLGEDKKHLGASFWLAVMSSVLSCLTGIFAIYLGHCRRR